jgi:hypothetical protein
VEGLVHPRAGRLPAGYIGRDELMRRTGLSLYEFRKLVGQGKIRSTLKQRRKVSLYSESLVEQVIQVRTARLRRDEVNSVTFSASEAVEVFRRIRSGQPLDLVLIELGMHPYTLQAIAREYEKLAGAMILSSAIVERINELPLEGTTVLGFRPQEMPSRVRARRLRGAIVTEAYRAPRAMNVVPLALAGMPYMVVQTLCKRDLARRPL